MDFFSNISDYYVIKVSELVPKITFKIPNKNLLASNLPLLTRKKPNPFMKSSFIQIYLFVAIASQFPYGC